MQQHSGRYQPLHCGEIPMNRFQKSVIACVGTLLTFTTLPFSQAAFHLWQITEVYSNASGTVQFIELHTATGNANGGSQQFVSGHTLASNGHTFNFTTNLPGDTLNKDFILATPGYFALGASVPTADYNLGVNNFFSVTGDTINFASVNTLTFTAGQLPTNGLNSLNRAFNPATPTTFTVGTNSPTNFSNTSGSTVALRDVNFDLHVNASDVSAMESALTNPSGYATTNGITTTQLSSVGNVNQDGSFNNGDLQALLNKLKTGGGTTSTVPEPNACILAALVGGLLWKSRRQFKINC
jgi:hypothetical protein